MKFLLASAMLAAGVSAHYTFPALVVNGQTVCLVLPSFFGLWRGDVWSGRTVSFWVKELRYCLSFDIDIDIDIPPPPPIHCLLSPANTNHPPNRHPNGPTSAAPQTTNPTAPSPTSTPPPSGATSSTPAPAPRPTRSKPATPWASPRRRASVTQGRCNFTWRRCLRAARRRTGTAVAMCGLRFGRSRRLLRVRVSIGRAMVCHPHSFSPYL